MPEFCERGFCVSVTPTRYVYKDGEEDGAIIGIINYPRFPEDRLSLIEKTRELAKQLKERFKQKRVSIMFDFQTETLGEYDNGQG